MRVWLAAENELDQAARLISEFRAHFGRAEPIDAEIREGVGRVAREGGEFLLAAAGGAAVGVVQLRYRWSVWTSSEDAWIEDVFVSEDARGTGLGRALVEAAIERARERGCRRIELDVDADNDPALALYRSLGFGDYKATAGSLLLGQRLG